LREKAQTQPFKAELSEDIRISVHVYCCRLNIAGSVNCATAVRAGMLMARGSLIAEGENFASRIKEMQSIIDKVDKEEIKKSRLMVGESG